MARADSAIRGCHALIDRLVAQGDNRGAESVRGVLRSLATARATCSSLHRDGIELRRQIDALERDT